MSNQRFNPEKENTVFVRKLRGLFDETKHTQQELIDYIKEKTGDAPTRQAVSMWLHGNKPDIETLPVIAEFFGVTTDYMLTETNVSTLDTELRTVCEYTGLSEQAIENLRKVIGCPNADLHITRDTLSGFQSFVAYTADIIIGKKEFVQLVEFLAIVKAMVIEREFYDKAIAPIAKENKGEPWLDDVLSKLAPDYKSKDRDIMLDLAEFKATKALGAIIRDIAAEGYYTSEAQVAERSKRAYDNIKLHKNAVAAAIASKKSKNESAEREEQILEHLSIFLEKYNEYLNRKDDENG